MHPNEELFLETYQGLWIQSVKSEWCLAATYKQAPTQYDKHILTTYISLSQ